MSCRSAAGHITGTRVSAGSRTGRVYPSLAGLNTINAGNRCRLQRPCCSGTDRFSTQLAFEHQQCCAVQDHIGPLNDDPEQRHLQPVQAADGAPFDRPRLVRYWYALSRSVRASGALGPPTGAQVEDPLLASSCLTGRITEPLATWRSRFLLDEAPIYTV